MMNLNFPNFVVFQSYELLGPFPHAFTCVKDQQIKMNFFVPNGSVAYSGGGGAIAPLRKNSWAFSSVSIFSLQRQKTDALPRFFRNEDAKMFCARLIYFGSTCRYKTTVW